MGLKKTVWYGVFPPNFNNHYCYYPDYASPPTKTRVHSPHIIHCADWLPVNRFGPLHDQYIMYKYRSAEEYAGEIVMPRNVLLLLKLISATRRYFGRFTADLRLSVAVYRRQHVLYNDKRSGNTKLDKQLTARALENRSRPPRRSLSRGRRGQHAFSMTTFLLSSSSTDPPQLLSMADSNRFRAKEERLKNYNTQKI